MNSSDIYQQITDRIIAQLEQGIVPWRKPWVSGIPANLISDKPYQGINAFSLMLKGYRSRFWLTFKQAKDRGGSVRKGEHGTAILLYKTFTKIDDEGEERAFPVLRTWTVFNVEQTEGIEYSETPPPFEPINECERVVVEWSAKPGIVHLGGDRAYYDIRRDCVNMPKRKQFKSAEGYYATLFHELVHATGGAKRLARPGVANWDEFGSEQYSEEELVAEMGAAMLCGLVGIDPLVIDNSVAYIGGWLGKVKKDKRLLISAASQAQKAVNMILGVTEQAQEAA